jgi:hypothetical protein
MIHCRRVCGVPLLHGRQHDPFPRLCCVTSAIVVVSLRIRGVKGHLLLWIR